MSKNNNPKKELCGVKLELRIAMSKAHREVIDNAAKKYDFKKIILPKKEDAFIVAFDSRIKRDGFVTAITPYLYGDVKYSYVNNIEE